MTCDPETGPASAPKWSRMPGAVRLELDREIVQHLRTHRSRYYDLLRDDPRFSPWIGSHRGSAGEKRLDRYIAEVRRNQPRKLNRPIPLSGLSALAAPEEHASAESSASHTPMVAGPFAAGSNLAMSFDELQTEVRGAIDLLRKGMEGCFNDYGELTNPQLFTKLYPQFLATIGTSPRLAKSFRAEQEASPFLALAIKRVLKEVPNLEASAQARLREDLENMFVESSGMRAGGGS